MYILEFETNTGSFRMNGKSKTIFMGINFHKKWVFTSVLGSPFLGGFYSEEQILGPFFMFGQNGKMVVSP